MILFVHLERKEPLVFYYFIFVRNKNAILKFLKVKSAIKKET